MPILTIPSRLRHRAAALLLTSCCLTVGCTSDDEPEGSGSETPDYWDQAQVDAACEAYGVASTMCGGSSVTSAEVAESCTESVEVDNPNMDPDCYNSIVQSFACIGGLSCSELIENVDGIGDFPCKAEQEAFAQDCS
jgi:hypothetical protein